jgi:hypothetical protein
MVSFLNLLDKVPQVRPPGPDRSHPDRTGVFWTTWRRARLLVCHALFLSKDEKKNGNDSPIFFFKLKTGLQNTVGSPPPPKNPGLWRSHLSDLPKNTGLWRSHLLDLPKNPGLWRCHLWSPGRPGPGTGTLPGGLTCARFDFRFHEKKILAEPGRILSVVK